MMARFSGWGSGSAIQMDQATISVPRTQMLTFETAQNATRQMNSYEELPTGALDHFQSKLTGHREERRTSSSPQTIADKKAPFVRRWSDEKGRYVYIER
jgi:hypothetical protein